MVFAPDGSMLASGGNDATIRLWDAGSGVQLQTLLHPGPIAVVVWSPDGRHLASGDVEGYVRLWEVHKSGPTLCVQTLAAHTNWVDGLAFAPDSSALASASWDGTVKLWGTSPLRPGSGQALRPGSPSSSPSTSSGRGSGTGQVTFKGGEGGARLRETLAGHTDRVNRVAWSPDGRTLASSSRDQTIWLWDVEQGSYRVALQGHRAGVYGQAFTPDSRSLLSGGDDGALCGTRLRASVSRS